MTCKKSRVTKSPEYFRGDDLSRIKGIGFVIQTRLHNAGILTFTQLGTASPEKLVEVVPSLSAKRIAKENWVKQARRLAKKAESPRAQTSEAVRETRQHYATFTVELLLGEDNSVRRTRATYVQTKLEECWAGWSEPRLSNFIAKCANLEKPETAFAPQFPISHRITQSPEPPALSSRTTDVPYKEHLADSKPKNVLCGILKLGNLAVITLGTITPQHAVHANEAFSVHIILDLVDVEVAPSTPLNCTTTIWAKKLGAGVRQIVGEQQITFMPVEKIPCTVESKITSQGTFRLEAMATLISLSTSTSPRSTIRAWSEGGLLQVY